jgi:vacuolar-type H+-ATPase subunit D/Vma8
LAALHDVLRIRAPQEPAWRELVDAVAAATRREPAAVTTGTPTDRLKARERELSDRIVALRALDLALSRLAAQVDETQRRLLSDGLIPLLDEMR